MEHGESPLRALRREVLEEVDVTIDIGVLADDPDLRFRQEDLDLSLWAVRLGRVSPRIEHRKSTTAWNG